MKPSMTWILLSILMGLALWPLPLVLFSTEAIGHPISDLAYHLHGAWWFGSELLQGHWPQSSTLTHFPEAPNLWYIDPVGGLMSGVLFRATGPATAWNLAILLQLLLAAFVGWRMGWDLLSSRVGAGILALTMSCSAPVLGFIHSGLSEFLGLAPVAGLIWASIRSLGWDPLGRPAPPKGPIWIAVCLSLCMLQSPYYGVAGALWLLCLLPGSGWRLRLKPLGLAAVFAALPIALISWGIQSNLTDPEAAVNAANAPGWNPSSLPATDLFGFIHPGPWVHPDTPSMGNPGILHIHYLGLMGVGLVVWTLMLRNSRRLGLGLPTLLFALFCLGPILSINRWHTGLPLPMAIFYVLDTPLQEIHHPYRFIGMALPLIGLWIGWAATQIQTQLQWAIPVLMVAETIYFSPVPWPLQTMETEAPDIYEALPNAAVLDWPADATHWNRRYLTWQTQHQRPVAVGVNVFMTDTLREDPLVGALANQLDDVHRRARDRDTPFSGSLEFRGKSDATELKHLGYGSIVLHLPALSPTEQERAIRILKTALGEPEWATEHAFAWAL